MSPAYGSLRRRLFVAAVITCAAPLAHAEGFVAFALVQADLPDVLPGDGKCSYIPNPPPGSMAFCTLRAAIMETNALPGKDTIYLTPAATYVLTQPGAPDGGEEGAQAGDLNITDPLLIQPIGAPNVAAIRATIDANGIDRVFYVEAAGEVELVNIRITGGFVPNGPSPGAQGIYVLGSASHLALRHVDLYGNEAESPYAGIAIALGAGLDVEDSEIHDNAGHGIYIDDDSGSVRIVRSVIYRNSQTGISNANGLFLIDSTVSDNGHGVNSHSLVADALTVIVRSTIADNQSRGIITSFASDNDNDVLLINTVLSKNAHDCGVEEEAVFEALNSLFSDDTCPPGDPADNNRIQPALLSALGDHGGPTPTHRPRTDSPLIDAGSSTFCEELQTDQRGLPRIADFPGAPQANCDIGAVELESDVIFWHDFEKPL